MSDKFWKERINDVCRGRQNRKKAIDLSRYPRRGTSIGISLDGPELKQGDDISWNGRIETVECVFTHRDRSGPRIREVVVRLKGAAEGEEG